MTHPHASKTALFSVTTGGMLKMHWLQYNNTYQETTKELESVHSSEDLITHAAITSDKCMTSLASLFSLSLTGLQRMFMWP